VSRSSWYLSVLIAALAVASHARAQDAGVPDGGVPDAGEAPLDEDEADWEEEEETEETEETEEEEPAEEEEEEETEEEGEEEEGQVEGQSEELPPAGRTTQWAPPEQASGTEDSSIIFPPFIYAIQGGIQNIGVFPLFYFREGQGTTELTIPPYYMMRGREEWDVLFPLFWFYRGEGHYTLTIPPFWSHSAPDGFDFGIAPLVMAGRHDDRHYTIIPPLLTADWGNEHERFTFATLFWRLLENDDHEHWGLFPFLWVENTPDDSYTIAPPFFFRFVDNEEHTALTVVPPFYHRDEPTGSYFGIPPLFHHNSGAGHTSTTIFPLLTHYSEEPEVMRLVAGGVFWYWRDHGDETIVTPVYQRFRGATEMDAVAPFFFSVRDPRDHSSALAIPPLIWHFEDPASVETVVFPFFARFDERGRETTWITPLVANHQQHETGDETTWVFPTLQVSRWHDGDAVNFYPLWFYESVPSHQHSVLAPFWFDFESFTGDRNRYTVMFPFFWRFREGNTTSTLVLNVYHRERVRSDSSEWEFHFFPFFAYGENSRGGHWWRIFEGLVGYERRGQYGITTLAYVPFQTDGPPLPPSND
jgi:hypothetical protein